MSSRVFYGRIFLSSLLLLPIIFLLLGCAKDDILYQSAFEKSERAWLDFKASSANNYSYTVTGSSWVGQSWETKLDIRDGKIVKRSFHYNWIGGQGRPDGGWTEETVKAAFLALGYTVEEFEARFPEGALAEGEWVEEVKDFGSHSNSPAAVLWTLDEVYSFAKATWLAKRSDATTSFEAKNKGMISRCGFVPNGCQDDCFNGISISKIEAL